MLIRFMCMFIFMFMFMFGDMPIIGLVIHICDDGDDTPGFGFEDVRSRPPRLLSAIEERLAAPPTGTRTAVARPHVRRGSRP
ncbi:hypothetical protein EVJ58_g8320 [Rhodofomes roseus]|uniref:Uncharacterized protein n=1 Tax=Rhodofomes roseus TaxID=34475 RepID=A0A4Y9Y1Q5_9APHY|nr:hypothetical protein EVJ58_g8320 [Rhodofomes roseus]